MPTLFLTPGNGHQTVNRKRALAVVDHFIGNCSAIDSGTLRHPDFGICHFGAYTSKDGAMISTPADEDHSFGSLDWHYRDHIVMFREVGDGRCMIYISSIKPLFDLRTIGYHGVSWENVRKTAKKIVVFKSEDALMVEANRAQGITNG